MTCDVAKVLTSCPCQHINDSCDLSLLTVEEDAFWKVRVRGPTYPLYKSIPTHRRLGPSRAHPRQSNPRAVRQRHVHWLPDGRWV